MQAKANSFSRQFKFLYEILNIIYTHTVIIVLSFFFLTLHPEKHMNHFPIADAAKGLIFLHPLDIFIFHFGDILYDI